MIYRFLILLFIVVLSYADSVYAGTFGAKEFYLKNGVRTIVAPNNKAPVVVHMVWYKVGAANDAQGYSGTAHYLEHLMFKGTEKIPAGEFSKTIRKLGGVDNAFTSYDYTSYYQMISSKHLATIMEMEADRILNLSPSPEDIESEHNVVIEERRQNHDSNPFALFREKMSEKLYGNHPYARPVIGSTDEITKLNIDEVNKFRSKNYYPDNIIIVVAGDVDPIEVQKIAENTFGKIPAKTVRKDENENNARIETGQAEKRFTMNHKDVHKPFFQRIKIVPSAVTNPDKALALQILLEIISGGPSTRIYKSLVVDKKIAVNAGIQYGAYAPEYGKLIFYATPAPDVDMIDLEKAFDNELAKIASLGVSKRDFEKAKQIVKAEAIFARDDIKDTAEIIGRALSVGLPLDYIENWDENIDSVSHEQVNDVAAEFLSAPYTDSITGYLLPVTGY